MLERLEVVLANLNHRFALAFSARRQDVLILHHTTYLLHSKFLPEGDRRALGRSRLINSDHMDEDDHEDGYDEDITSAEQQTHNALIDKPSACRVNIIQSPY